MGILHAPKGSVDPFAASDDVLFVARLIQGAKAEAGAIGQLSEFWRPIAEAIVNRNGSTAVQALDKILDGRPDVKAIRRAIFAVDTTKATPAITYSTLADVAAVLPSISFAWDSWLVNGYPTLVAAQSGEGKSHLLLEIARRQLLELDWPDGSPGNGVEHVLWADTEATQALLLDRAKSLHIPLERILFPTEDPLADFRIDDPNHWERFVAIAQAKRPLIVVDSLRGAHRGDESSSEMQELMTRLARLVRDLNVPCLVAHHLRKPSMTDKGGPITLDRLRGSSAIAAMSRVIWGIDAPDPNRRERRRLVVVKSNLSKLPDPLGFEISEAGITWCQAPSEPRTETVQDRAEEFLLATLGKEPLSAAYIFEEANQAGISERTLKRAKATLGIVSVKDKGGRWVWSLPARGE